MKRWSTTLSFLMPYFWRKVHIRGKMKDSWKKWSFILFMVAHLLKSSFSEEAKKNFINNKPRNMKGFMLCGFYFMFNLILFLNVQDEWTLHIKRWVSQNWITGKVFIHSSIIWLCSKFLLDLPWHLQSSVYNFSFLNVFTIFEVLINISSPICIYINVLF